MSTYQSPLGAQATIHFDALTPERILSAVESLGFRCSGRCLALNSMENRVFEVELELDRAPLNASERFVVLKFYRPGRWSEEQILEEHRFLFDLQEAEIPVIAPLTRDGQSMFRVELDQPLSFAVFPKQGGRNPQELSLEQLPQIGRLLARMHNVGRQREAKQRLRLNPENMGLASLDYLLQASVLPQEMQAQFSQLLKSICGSAKALFDSFPQQRIHGDCHMGNIICSNESFSLVDFDDMSVGPCVQDLWLLIPGRDQYARRQLEALLEGYEQMASFDWQSLALIEPLRALRLIYFSAWIAKRYEDKSFKRAFPDFGSIKYWRELFSDLHEQWEFMQTGQGWGLGG